MCIAHYVHSTKILVFIRHSSVCLGAAGSDEGGGVGGRASGEGHGRCGGSGGGADGGEDGVDGDLAEDDDGAEDAAGLAVGAVDLEDGVPVGAGLVEAEDLDLAQLAGGRLQLDLLDRGGEGLCT